MEISDSAYTPLPDGTHATIRSASLSGIANRYVDLHLPASATERRSPPAGRSPADTTSEVDLDQIFNTLNKPTVDHLKQVIHGFAAPTRGWARRRTRASTT